METDLKSNDPNGSFKHASHCVFFFFFLISNAAAAASLQSCRTLCDPIDGTPPGSPVPGILQKEHWSGMPFPSPMHESEK